MAIKKLKLSTKATEQLQPVRQRLRLDGREKLWVLRIALARSLQTNYKIDSVPNRRKSKDGFEIELSTLEQRDGVLLRALLQQHYQRRLEDDEYVNYLLWHTEHGLEVIHEQTQSRNGDEYLVLMIREGMEGFKTGDLWSSMVEDDIQPGYKDVLAVRIGVDKETSQPIVINFNKTDEHINNYMGIVGKPGRGKTYFAKYFLTELRKASRFKTNFVIFDYAKGDIADDKSFVRKSRAKVLSVDRTPIPINIFTTPSLSAQDKRFAAERIVHIVRTVEANIGKVQENNLYKAITNAYQQVASDSMPYPDFQLVREELELIKDVPDSLTSVFRPLTEHNLFATREMPFWKSLLDRTIIFDIHRLPALKDLCVFLVLNEMYRQLMLLPDSKVDATSQAREMRTIIVIDEAHHFLKSKKRVSILEDIIREIRSKGASVMLLSQSPDDYNHAEFNFLELLEFVYVLGSNPSSHKFLQQSFGLSLAESKKLMRDVTELSQGEAFSKTKDKKLTQILLCR